MSNSVDMTQKEVAEEAGISIKVVQKIESDCEKVHFANLYAYLTVVDVNTEKLLKSVLKPLGLLKKRDGNQQTKKGERKIRKTYPYIKKRIYPKFFSIDKSGFSALLFYWKQETKAFNCRKIKKNYNF